MKKLNNYYNEKQEANWCIFAKIIIFFAILMVFKCIIKILNK